MTRHGTSLAQRVGRCIACRMPVLVPPRGSGRPVGQIQLLLRVMVLISGGASLPIEGAYAQAGVPDVTAVALAGLRPVFGADTLPVLVAIRLPPGAHVNSSHPNDPRLIPTRVRLEAGNGFRVLETAYPRGQMSADTSRGQPDEVYDGVVVMQVKVEVPAEVPSGRHPLRFAVDYQACRERICFRPATAFSTVQVHVPSRQIDQVRLSRVVLERMARAILTGGGA